MDTFTHCLLLYIINVNFFSFQRQFFQFLLQVSFFSQAVGQASTSGGVHDSGMWTDALAANLDPANAPVPSLSFTLMNELILEGRGSIVLQKRACVAEEKKAKENTCSEEHAKKYWGLTKCSSETCEIGMPAEIPDVSIQAKERAVRMEHCS